MSKRKRQGETVTIDFVTFMRLVRVFEERRLSAKWYAGERARLIEACEELQAKLRRQHESNGRACTTLRQLTEERQQINQAIRTMDYVMQPYGDVGGLRTAWAPLVAFLPSDAPPQEGE